MTRPGRANVCSIREGVCGFLVFRWRRWSTRTLKVHEFRTLMKNIAYVGALCALMEIDRAIVRTLLEETFAAKPKLVEPNFKAVTLGYGLCGRAFRLPVAGTRRADGWYPRQGFLIEGNVAAALGCLYAGATVGAWYPITPSTSLMDAFEEFLAVSTARIRRPERTATASSRPRTSWPRRAW